jgi:hypothetical protein
VISIPDIVVLGSLFLLLVTYKTNQIKLAIASIKKVHINIFSQIPAINGLKDATICE